MNIKVRKVIVAGDVAHVVLTKGYIAQIDAVDIDLVAPWNWYALVQRRSDGTIRSVYAVRGQRVGKKVKMVLMHRTLMGEPVDALIDHVDGDGLNNRRTNLRQANVAQNQHNQRISTTNTSGHKGVTWHKKCQMWQAQIKVYGKNVYLGLFATAEMAADAYQAASRKAHGEFARAA